MKRNCQRDTHSTENGKSREVYFENIVGGFPFTKARAHTFPSASGSNRTRHPGQGRGWAFWRLIHARNRMKWLLNVHCCPCYHNPFSWAPKWHQDFRRTVPNAVLGTARKMEKAGWTVVRVSQKSLWGLLPTPDVAFHFVLSPWQPLQWRPALFPCFQILPHSTTWAEENPHPIWKRWRWR